MTESVLLTCLDGKQGWEERIPVIYWASSPHLSILNHWVAWIGRPSLTERLFVHVAVKKDTVFVCWVCWVNINDQKRGATLIFQRGDSATFQFLSLCESLQMITLFVEIAIFLPLWVIQRREWRDPYEFCLNNMMSIISYLWDPQDTIRRIAL